MCRVVTIASFFLLAVTLAGCAGGPAADKPQAVNVTSLPAGATAAAQGDSPLSRAVLKDVNAFRASKGAGALMADATLQRAAAVHAADMSGRGFFGHHNPEGQGPRERVLAVNPGFKGRVAENIQMVEGPTYAAMSDETLAQTLTDKWAQSPTHRKNMQMPDMTHSGIGIARSGDRIIAVQVFSGP
ncbi:CAP domain-containing protein [Parvibaculum sp.]|uniref:CAP domain-containing protein n=1 Tax=Parvibaculum sp. TaxID=2024848 RepID=UPI002730F0DF|nr:CAP domain-containing protein [Parvibaculum sp.]MDP1626494.1 CAP domain-containing protein [Parvibaculum sp.]MDP2150416.1 CAP domain-containing protein [Parvibaculum sp.]MDP3329023.1 CAP domain-containing protein [Parvibaculum sp.]